MARPTKAVRLGRVFREAQADFNRIQSATWDDRTLSRNDRRFATIPGAQWEGPLQLQFENKPRFELNRIQGARIRLIGEHRANRAMVQFLPRDGTSKDELALACEGRFRADWTDSHGDNAGDNAFSEQITGGVGAMRLRSVAEDEDDIESERQRIVFEPIVDADISVFWDLNSKDQQKRDAMHCFVVTAIERASFLKQFPKQDPATWPVNTDSGGTQFDWYTPDVVKVAEYYVVEHIDVLYFDVKPLVGDGYELSEDDLDNDPPDDHDEDEDGPFRTKRETLLIEGATITEGETKKVRQVHKYLLSGSEVLEDCGIINGKCIPVAPFYGIRDFIDNKERWSGIVRVTADAQRVVNMGFSRLVEINAFSPISVPVFTPEEVMGQQGAWAKMNIEPAAYMLRNMVDGPDGNKIALPMQYTKPPDIPPATPAILAYAGQELKDLLGNNEQREPVTPNMSGKAIELIQQSKDVMTFIYLDNFKLGMERVGEIYLSMLPDVYVEEGRKMKVVGPDMKTRSSITLGEPGVDQDDAIQRDGVIDFSRAKFDVVVDVGPSTVTKRAAHVSALTQVLAVMPQEAVELRETLALEILLNLDSDSPTSLGEYARKKLVERGVEEPTEEEAAEMAKRPPPPPAPQDIANMAFAEKEKALRDKAIADTALSQANKTKVEAETGLTTAKTIQTVANVDHATRNPPQAPNGGPQ